MKSCLLVTCSFLLLATHLYGANNLFWVVVIVSLLTSCLIEWWKPNKWSFGLCWHWTLRDTKETGHWCIVLVPTAVYVANRDSFGDLYCESLIGLSLLLLVNTLLFTIATAVLDFIVLRGDASRVQQQGINSGKDGAKDKREPKGALGRHYRLCTAITGVILIAVESCGISSSLTSHLMPLHADIQWLLVVFTCTSLLVHVAVFTLLPRLLPKCFTVGEAAICSQAVALLVFATLSNVLHKVEVYELNSHYLASLPNVVAFMEVASLSCALVIAAVGLVPLLRHSLAFYFLVPGIAAAFSLPVLYPVLKQDFVTWLALYITQDRLKLALFAYWCGTNGVAVIVLYLNALPCLTPSPAAMQQDVDVPPSVSSGKKKSKSDKTSSSQLADHTAEESKLPPKKSRSRLSTLVRKQFHLVAIGAVLPGLVWDIKIASLAVTCGVIVFVMLECVRVLNVWPVGDILNLYLPLYVDDQDQGPVILTHIYLLTALAIPLWLWDLNVAGITPLPLYCGLLSVGIGDAAASVVGSKLGRLHWPGSRKTLEGTTAAVLSQLVSIKCLEYFEFTSNVYWPLALAAVMATSALEALTDQIDNLVLPVYMFSLLMCAN